MNTCNSLEGVDGVRDSCHLPFDCINRLYHVQEDGERLNMNKLYSWKCLYKRTSLTFDFTPTALWTRDCVVRHCLLSWWWSPASNDFQPLFSLRLVEQSWLIFACMYHISETFVMSTPIFMTIARDCINIWCRWNESDSRCVSAKASLSSHDKNHPQSPGVRNEWTTREVYMQVGHEKYDIETWKECQVDFPSMSSGLLTQVKHEKDMRLPRVTSRHETWQSRD